MASPVIAARTAVPELPVWKNRPSKASPASGIAVVSKPAPPELDADSYSGISQQALAALEKIEHITNFPAGAIIFMEGQLARGVLRGAPGERETADDQQRRAHADPEDCQGSIP